MTMLRTTIWIQWVRNTPNGEDPHELAAFDQEAIPRAVDLVVEAAERGQVVARVEVIPDQAEEG